MMTLKAFKDAVKVGTQITVLDHWIPQHHGVRTVTRKQTNGYWFTQVGDIKSDGTPILYWGIFPKASELQFDGKLARITIGDKFFVLAFNLPVNHPDLRSAG